jgi:hypothetical protein
MKKYAFIIISIFLCSNIGITVFSQEKKRVKVEGEIVAYDKLSPLISITSAPKIQTFILKVDKVIKGDESESYIIVVHKTFDNENKVLKKVLNGNNKVKLKINREKSCDSSLENLQNVKLEGKPQSQEDLSRVEWINNKATKPDSKMPCYLLNDDGITFIK